MKIEKWSVSYSPDHEVLAALNYGNQANALGLLSLSTHPSAELD
jgi:hypothetical protein